MTINIFGHILFCRKLHSQSSNRQAHETSAPCKPSSNRINKKMPNRITFFFFFFMVFDPCITLGILSDTSGLNAQIVYNAKMDCYR